MNVPPERPEVNSEVPQSSGISSNVRNEQDQDRHYGDRLSHIAHDSYILGRRANVKTY